MDSLPLMQETAEDYCGTFLYAAL